MNVINGINDFEEMIECEDVSAMIEFWDTVYYPKYKDVLDHQLKYLYHTDKNAFYQFIKDIDIKNAKKYIRLYEDCNIEVEITNIVKNVADDLRFYDEFDVYIMMGFGHVGGTSGRRERSFVYYGVETFLQNGVDYKYIVPHELNHLIRISALGDYVSELGTDSLSFGDVMMLEGLGAAYSVVYLNGSNTFDSDKFNKSLMIPKETYKILESNEKEFINTLLTKANDKMSVEDWRTYFMINASSKSQEYPTAMGYYVGGKLVFKLLEKGFSILELTKMDSKKLISLVWN